MLTDAFYLFKIDSINIEIANIIQSDKGKILELKDVEL
jgi:hypothetical protein